MLTVAMLLGVMPVDLLGGIASVKAAETVHEVNFTKLPVEGKKIRIHLQMIWWQTAIMHLLEVQCVD